MNYIENAKIHFETLLRRQLERVERIANDVEPVDYSKLDKIIIGVVGGDGIGTSITAQAQRLLAYLLDKSIKDGRIEIRTIDGLTIENRVKEGKGIPSQVLTAIKECNVILKGPTTTPRAGDGWPNIESANVAMRKELDLFANVRPVQIPNEGIDWVFFRENTEGSYAVGDSGITIADDLAVDFTITTKPGTTRIIRAAFDYARRNHKSRVTAISKANIIKTTDGMFLKHFYEIAEEYPDIQADDWYIDIMTAKLVDEKRRRDFQVMVLPNLYGDILTDEAAEFQGGVGTAGSANIGNTYAMFEAIHGSAPRMVTEGRDRFADPCSVIRASQMLLDHIGFSEQASVLGKALQICTQREKKLVITGREGGATTEQFTDYLIETINKLS